MEQTGRKSFCSAWSNLLRRFSGLSILLQSWSKLILLRPVCFIFGFLPVEIGSHVCCPPLAPSWSASPSESSDSLPSIPLFAAATTMDIPSEIEKLEAKMEVLEAKDSLNLR